MRSYTDNVVAVCVVNLIKCGVLFMTAYIYARPENQPLSTLGDALATFLKNNDQSTQPLRSKQAATVHFAGENSQTRHKQRYHRAATFKRWTWLLVPSVHAIPYASRRLDFS